jgi:hypothetical protein
LSNILPTVGRVLYFQPGPDDRVVRYDEQPMRADIIYVHGPDNVKLHVIDHAGNHFTLASVPLVQDGDERPTCGYAYWMPYQVGQAKVATPPGEPQLSKSPEGALVEGAGVVSTEHFNAVAGGGGDILEAPQGAAVTHQPV